MEDKNKTGVLDNLTTPSLTNETPLFSLKNFFKPTSKNVMILGTVIKSGAASIVLFAATLVMTNPILAVWLTVGAVVVGGLGEALVSFTKEEPVSTLARAVEDIQIEKIEDDTEQH